MCDDVARPKSGFHVQGKKPDVVFDPVPQEPFALGLLVPD
jgi:hypothetical protein